MERLLPGQMTVQTRTSSNRQALPLVRSAAPHNQKESVINLQSDSSSGPDPIWLILFLRFCDNGNHYGTAKKTRVDGLIQGRDYRIDPPKQKN